MRRKRKSTGVREGRPNWLSEEQVFGTANLGWVQKKQALCLLQRSGCQSQEGKQHREVAAISVMSCSEGLCPVDALG
jgi:hypothetical protein